MILGRELLRGPRVYLSALSREDTPTITRWYQDAEFMRLLDAPPASPRPPSYTEEWLEAAHKSKTAYSFGIRLIEDDALIGLIELEDILWNHGVTWLGIGIGEPGYWGQGYGSEAMSLMLRFAFHELNLHRVQLTVFEYNERAIAAYEKLGFVREGVFRDFLHRDGQRHDMYLYGLLRPEWEEMQDD
jgi:RimJ/RimL family protein N-acetyltransferase